jgi:DNA-binding NarL/FixJ family response regulator
LLYYECMTRVYLADALLIERKALHFLLLDINMEIAGEAGDWSTVMANVPHCQPDMLVVDLKLLPSNAHAALAELRGACPNMLVIVLIPSLEARQQAALMVGADVYISKSEIPGQVAAHLRAAAGNGETGKSIDR